MRLASLLVLVVCLLRAAAVFAEDGVSARVRVGAGVAQRLIEVPGAELALGPVPALMVGIDGGARVGAWVFGLGLTYRTTLLGRVMDASAGVGAAMSETAVRSHGFEAGLRGAFLLGPREHAVSFGLFAGYDVRAFASVAVLRVPRFSLHGPLLRVEIELPLRAAGMRLLLGPEVVGVLGGLAHGIAVGGLLRLELPVGEAFALQVDYRESHVFLSGFSDVERYLVALAAVRFP